MWIRSQDKRRLINVNEVWIIEHNEKYEIQGVNNTIAFKNGYILGVYETKERALEILNEIQKHLMECTERMVNFNYDYANYSNTTYFEKSNVVYQMPER